jgi:hypothetical protein
MYFWLNGLVKLPFMDPFVDVMEVADDGRSLMWHCPMLIENYAEIGAILLDSELGLIVVSASARSAS